MIHVPLPGRAACVPGLLALALVAAVPARAQDDSVRAMYRVEDHRFIVGAWGLATPAGFNTSGNYGSMARVWPLADSLGVQVLTFPVYLQWPGLPRSTLRELDTLCALADSAKGQAIVPKDVLPFTPLGFGREATFYPFDSTRLPEFPMRFTVLQGGAPVFTGVSQRLYYERPDANSRGHRAIEYTSTNTDSTQPVASGVAYDWTAAQIYRWPAPGRDADSVQNSDLLLTAGTAGAGRMGEWDTSRIFVVLTGLTPNSGVDPATAVFTIDVVQEIPNGSFYDNNTRRAQQDTTRICTTLAVTKSQLMPADPNNPDDLWEWYGEAAFAVNLVDCENPPGTAFDGPMSPLSESRRFDVVVHWTGRDTATLRSVQLRTPWAQSALGWRPEDWALRRDFCDTAGHLLYGRERDALEVAGRQ